MKIILDPSNGGRIGGTYGIKGKVTAYVDKNNNIAVMSSDSCCPIARGTYEDFVAIDGSTFDSNQEVLNYIQENYGVEEGITTVSDLTIPSGEFVVGDTSNQGSTRKILPSDLNLSLSGSTVPVKDSSTNTWGTNGMRVSTTPINSSIPFRVSGGRTKTADATEIDDAVTLNQFQGITNNTLTNAETSTTLNAAYPSIAIGSIVRTITNTTKYTKISATQWQKETITVI